MEEKIEGPVQNEERAPIGTRIHIDLPAKPVVAVSGGIFVYSGYFLYQTLKAIYKVNHQYD